MAWLQTLPLPLIGLAVFAALLLCLEFGYRATLWIRRRRRAAAGGEGEKPLGAGQDHLLTAMLGLLALLLGFTFSLALNRFEARRDLVVQEANALGSAWNYALQLREPDRSNLGRLLRDYVETRASWSETYAGRDGMAATDRLQKQLWIAAGAATRAEASEPIARGLIDSIDRGFNVATARLAARSAHIPDRVLNLLLLYIVLAVAMLGQVSATREGLHRVSTGLLLLLLTLALVVILDLDRTGEGAIMVSQQPLLDLHAAIR